MAATQDVQNCSTHCQNLLEFFCSNCKNIACKDCKHVLSCYKNNHEMIPIHTALEEFNKNAMEVIKTSEVIKKKLERMFDSIFENKANFEHQLKLCRTAIEIQTKTILEKVKEQSNELLLKLENLHQEKNEAIDVEIKELDAMKDEVNHLKTSVNSIMNKPEETETLGKHKERMASINNKILKHNNVQSLHKQNIPIFIPSALNEKITTESLGNVFNCNLNYHVVEDDRLVRVTKGQPFQIKVSGKTDIGSCQITVNLTNNAGETSATEIENHGSGECKIKGRCKVEGDWQMEITIGDLHIKGSPVNIKVEKLGLVKTIENTHIPNIMSGVILHKDGCILVSSYSNEILQLNQSGSYIKTIHVPQEVEIKRMHTMSNGLIIYSNHFRTAKCVMCDETFQNICSFGEGLLQKPNGLTINEESRVLYVADIEAGCVFKFNIDDGRLLGKIDGYKTSKLNRPIDVAIMENGNMAVADFGNDRIYMFGANEDLMKILVDCSQEDGYVWGPCGLLVDADGNLIVSSNHKLQLFDMNGVFIKRLDDESDGLDIPFGISIISNRPRRVAVANRRANNLKIFNY